MLRIATNIICNALFSYLEIYMTKVLSNIQEENSKIKKLIIFVLLTAVNCVLFQVEYNVEAVILKTILGVIILKNLYNESLSKITITFLIFVLLTTLADVINYSILKQFFTLEEQRSSWYVMLISNIDVALIVIGLSKIPIIRNTIIRFIDKLDKKNILTTIIFLFLSFFVIITVLLRISKNQHNNEIYIMNILIISIFFILIIILILDKEKYNQLLTKYDAMSNYALEFEDSIEEMELNHHEYKNQLAILKSYVENNNKKQAIRVLNELSNENIKNNSKSLVELKNVPKGGIKGLLYYKIMIAEQKNLNVTIEVSNKSRKSLEQLTEEQIKILSRLIGVYLDNAIEAAEKTEAKIISIEIYPINNKLNLVFSNSIENINIRLEDIPKKGVTTKGKGRGKGVYLVNKLISKYDWIKCKTKIINNYYVQYIEIDKINP